MTQTIHHALAQRAAEPDPSQERRQLLRFALGDALYAVPIEAVREILQVVSLTEVPMMPRFVRGVMNLRGSVVPVFDLSQRLSLPRTEIGRRSCIVIVETHNADGQHQRHGVLVDAVHEVLELCADDVAPAPSIGTRVSPQFIGGIARVHGQSVELLDLPRIFDETELHRLVGEHCDQSRWLH